jgi:hypothetical protein
MHRRITRRSARLMRLRATSRVVAAAAIGNTPMRLGVLACAAALTACSGGADTYYLPYAGGGSSTIRTISIETNWGANPDEPTGNAAGVWVDYVTGGSWRVRTTCNLEHPCDSDPSGKCPSPPCAWDIVTTIQSGSLEVSGADVLPEDSVYRVSDTSVRLVFQTAEEIDGVALKSDPGAELSLDVMLDGQYDSSFVNWIAEGDTTAVSTGAPSDPVVFAPSTP